MTTIELKSTENYEQQQEQTTKWIKVNTLIAITKYQIESDL